MENRKELTASEMEQVSGGTSMEYLALTSLIIAVDPSVTDAIRDPANRDYTLFWILSHVPEISEVSFSRDGANTAVDNHGKALSHDELMTLLRGKFSL